MIRDKLMVAQSTASNFKGIVGVNSSVTCVGYAVDSGSNSYVLGGTEVTTPSGGFVVSLSKSGNINWQRKITKADEAVIVYAVKQDTVGNVYAYTDVGTSLQLLKYNNAGVLQWQRKLTSTSTVNPIFLSSQMQIDSSSNVYILIDHGTATREVIIVKYNSSGTLQWQKKYTRDSVALTSKSLSIDASDSLYIGMGYGTSGTNAYSLRKMNSSGVEVASVAVSNTSWTGNAGGILSLGTDVFLTTGIPSIIGAELTRLNSSLVYQGSTLLPSTAYVFSIMGSTGSSVIPITSDFNKYANSTSAPSISGVRLFDSSVGANEGLFGATKDTDLIVLGGRAYITSASRFDAVMTCLDPVSDLGTYTPMSISSVSTSQTAGSNRIGTAQTLTLSNSTLTDTAGDVTDSAGTYAVTLYPKT